MAEDAVRRIDAELLREIKGGDALAGATPRRRPASEAECHSTRRRLIVSDCDERLVAPRPPSSCEVVRGLLSACLGGFLSYSSPDSAGARWRSCGREDRLPLTSQSVADPGGGGGAPRHSSVEFMVAGLFVYKRMSYTDCWDCFHVGCMLL